ncbi:family 78 glycoside hydrolase catalytic domain [Allokutzneria albata]|uniref:alpha-L-rhamnosidase n=1 Tax=Allokutzneria albata TaxID=211114 RepID=A0A1G9RZP6_ALLAB|nr:family 78 glycoside hydrolase catalytic domain [Allokutzneria albata]SDM28634.1 alpha-L-rhamnosidase [Allokutzneria albata]
MAEPSAVRIEHLPRRKPVVVGTPEPRLSWQASATELELTDASGQVRRHRLGSADQVLVPWPFPPLPSRFRGSLRVRASDSDWSEPTTFETPLLHPEDWSARFITPCTIGRIGDPAPVFSGRISLPDKVVRARLHMTSLGVHVASINGDRVGDIHLDPGWTSYEHRLRYRTHDVTSLLRAGDNDIDVLLGNGWYRGRLGWHGKRAHYGDRLALLAQLEVACEDGSEHVFGTDTTWTARSSHVLADDLYDGQTTDLRGVESTEDSVEVLDFDFRRLEAPLGPPVRAVATVPAVSVTTSPSGKLLADFGENLVGWVRLRVHAGATEVTVRHAEVLEHGELGTRPLRSAQATDRYLLTGNSAAVCEPSLTFHGFRYAEVDGVGWLDPSDLEAVVLSSDLPATGWFSCSEPDLETLHENVRRAMRGNFLDVPTDCPQRDERLGWTGDIQVFGPAASFLADSAGFLTSWLRDLAADQYRNGCVPFVVPDVLREPAPSAAAWGDAATIVPWTLYQRYGDVRVLADQFASMRAWVDRQAALAGPDHIWSGGFQFGDWLDPAAPPDNPFAARTDHDIVATAHFAYSASIVAKAAEVLGRQDEARNYGDLAAAVREAFARAYVTPSGRMVGDAPTAYAMALVWDLLPTAEQRAGAGARLADLVRANGFRIATGFVGTPIIADALCLAGQPQVAYRLLLERGCPSWLYPVTMGATTIWERWDSMLPDGTINPGEMTSFNHYALGAVADWMHRTVAGLAPGAPGYRSLLVRPLPGGGLTHASARHETPYGLASVAWQRQDGTLSLEVEVPGGSSAIVHVPGANDPELVGPGKHWWEVPDPVAAPKIRTIRDAVDDPGLWAALVEVAAELKVAADGPALGRALSRDFDRPVEELPTILVSTLEHTSGQELRHRLEEVLARG